MSLDTKDPEEIITVTFNMSAHTDSPQNPAVTCAAAFGGADPEAASMLDGAPQISGANVLQRIKGGIAGVRYTLRCRIDTPDGSRFVEADVLPVKIDDGD